MGKYKKASAGHSGRPKENNNIERERKAGGSRREVDREGQSKTAGGEEEKTAGKRENDPPQKKTHRFICNKIANHPFLFK